MSISNLNNAQLFMKLYETGSLTQEQQDILAEIESRLSFIGFFPKPMVDYTYLTEDHAFKWFTFGLSKIEANETPEDAKLMVQPTFSIDSFSIPFIKRQSPELIVETQFEKYKEAKKLDGRAKKTMIKELYTIIKLVEEV